MSLATPTLQEVSDNIIAQLESSLAQSVPMLPKAALRVLAKALSGTFILLWKYAGFIFLQQFVSTASWNETTINGRTIRPLVEWGRLIGVGDPEPATRAELQIAVTVETSGLGGTLRAGEQLLRSSTGVIYLTTAAVNLFAPVVNVTIRASSDQQGGTGEGAIGNLVAGDEVAFASPLAGVVRRATVVSQVVTGSDGESETAYRSRVVERFQRRPQGGAYADFRTWGKEPAGIVQIYPYTGLPGEVDVYVLATEASSGSVDGVPTAAQLLEVRDLINLDVTGLASRRPVWAALNVHPITRDAFDVRISGLDTNGTTDEVTLRDTLEAALDEYLRTREPFIVGLSVLPRRDRITRAALGGIASEAADALGATFTTLEIELGGIPLNADTLDTGRLAKLGVASYIS